MSMFFAVPDAIYQRVAMWHVRRNYTRVQSAFRMVYIALLLSTIGHYHVQYPIKAHLTISCIIDHVMKQFKTATRYG
jgi:uncharacterized protein YybS (DUF2232 family)